MKILFMSLALSLAFLTSEVSAQVKVDDWKIERHGDEATLILKSDEDLKTDLTINSGIQKVIEVKRMGTNLFAIIYSTGVAGTQVAVEVIQAVIFHTGTRQFLGDYPYQYKSESSPYKLDQPKWKLDGKSLKITDENTDLDISINF